MRNDKRLFFFIEVTLACIVMVLAFFMLQGKYGEEPEKVSVIIQDSDDDRWAAFIYGLKMAAQDQKIELFVVTTEGLLTVEEQENLIESEIGSGADGVILQPVLNPETEQMLSKIQKKLPVMLVEYPVSEESNISVLPAAEPDNYAMGAALAQELLKDFNGKVEGKTIGIFYQPDEAEAGRIRKQGFADTLKDTGITMCWEISDTPESDGENILETREKVDFVIALDDRSMTIAGEASAARNLHGALVYGIGHSMEAVYYLDTGYTECLIVPDEFNVGYQSLTEVAAGIRQPFRKMQDITVSYAVMRKETLFSKENQEILFTMSQ